MNQEALEKIFTESFAEYGDAIFRFCFVKVSQRELAEDMTQEVFTRYWQSLRAGKEMKNTRAFLYTIAYNLAKDWYKKKKSSSLEVALEQGLQPADVNTSPELSAEHREVLSTLEELDEKDREVLVFKYVDGLPPAEIAALLEETPNVISVRIHRATVKLQKRLQIKQV